MFEENKHLNTFLSLWLSTSSHSYLKAKQTWNLFQLHKVNDLHNLEQRDVTCSSSDGVTDP